MNKLVEIFETASFADPTAIAARPAADSTTNYFIAFTPRSGSSWLTGLLTSTRCLGRPEEWFNPDNLPRILENFPQCDLRGYVEMARKRFKTPNRVFGFEASFFQIKQVEELVPLEELFGSDLLYIYLTRRDFVSQAVSLYRAVESGYFHSVQKLSADQSGRLVALQYSNEKIEFWCRHILQQEFGFARMFAQKNVTPLRMSYEELEEDPPAFVRRIAKHVGVETALSPQQLESHHRKLANTESQAWARRFSEESPEFVKYWHSNRGKSPRRVREHS